MSKSQEKRAPRDLQLRTGWTYSECLRCVRTMSAETIEVLIRARAENGGVQW